MQQTVKQQQLTVQPTAQDNQQHAGIKHEPAGAALKHEVKQEQQDSQHVLGAGSSSQHQAAAGGSSAAGTSSCLPQWVRCTACKRTVLPLKLAAHQANCQRRKAVADRQAAALAAKAASQGRPATPPLSTTSGRSGGGTAAAAAGGKAGSGGGGSKGRRGSSYLNPNRSVTHVLLVPCALRDFGIDRAPHITCLQCAMLPSPSVTV